ncbi:MAG: hypothetical protein N3F05_00660 [Candidatus Diapherotrites archaeon]|nr:hypothetical protein [Candidatus Diapherotrites archaeon]
MSEEFIDIISDLILQSENILRSISELRKADNRRKEIESELIESAMSKREDPRILHEADIIDAVISDLRKDIINRIITLSESMDKLKTKYNERFKNSIGEFKDLGHGDKNV